MHPPAVWRARKRAAFAVPFAALLTLIAQPVAAAPDPQGQVNSATAQLHAAQAQAGAEDAALSQAQSQLASADARLAALQSRISALDATLGSDTSHLQQVQQRLAADRSHLASYLRASYEQGGSEAALIYLLSASSIADAMQRKVQLDNVAVAVQDLLSRIHEETEQAAAVVRTDMQAKAQLQSAQEQASTEQAVISVQTEQVAAADAAAHAQVSQAKNNLAAAQTALLAEQAQDAVFDAVPGATFTIDTDLTKPSGETAARLDNFLQGTGLAGLGQSFMNAEHAYHVSARYFVAHAILESDWGSSAIAQDKHNLFGFNADDANPFGDATTFPSFDACIQYVAQFIAANYLSPSGPFYHGPTLRGMNVDYATDPDWANKIASIADTIP